MKKGTHPPAFPLEINERRKERFEIEAVYYNNCTCYDKGNSTHCICVNHTQSWHLSIHYTATFGLDQWKEQSLSVSWEKATQMSVTYE